MFYGRSVRRAFAAVVLTVITTAVAAQIPPVSISTPKEEVDDGFLSYLHGLLYNDLELRTDGETFRRTFPEFVPEFHSPIYDIELFARSRTGLLTIGFSVPLRWQVPVDILGLHPVELQGANVIRFREIVRPIPGTLLGEPSDGDLPDDRLPSGVNLPPDTSEVMVLALTSGYMRVDFAPWLDFLGGRILDDVDVKLIALVRYKGSWLALMGGWNPAGRSMVWAFDMERSQFMVNPPRPLSRFGRDLVDAATAGP